MMMADILNLIAYMFFALFELHGIFFCGGGGLFFLLTKYSDILL